MEIYITQQQKGILTQLTKNRVKQWVKQGLSETQMKNYLHDARWRNAMHNKVIEFEQKHF